MQPPASYRFQQCDVQLVDALRRELTCSETLAWVLARRGITPEQATALLTVDPTGEAAALHDPLLLGDMPAAVERIQYAIEQGEQIVVHGDYDCDGICATTLLVEGLESLGADVRAFLPDRFTNGYGLRMDQVERFAADGANLLITVDCGITAVEESRRAVELGLDMIVCDHHRPGTELPEAIIASTRPSDYPFPELCATAVAGKLVLALGGPSGPEQHELEAIATIADCMPLVDENRVLVQRGLRALRTTNRPGLLALINQSGLRVHDVDADAVGFKLAPRLNATGRVDHPDLGYELMRAAPSDASALAERIDAVNDRRRQITSDVVDAARQQVLAWSATERDARIYVVHGPGWHEGVVGIVASKLAEEFWRPVLVVSDGAPARGSGRSVDGVDLHAALAACDDLLIGWGGHAQAAGITVDPAQLDALRERLASWGSANIPEELLAPIDLVDAVVPASELRMDLVHELERLAPFGTGWERPRLLALDVAANDVSSVGDGTHLRCKLQIDGATVPAIGFGLAVHAPLFANGGTADVAFRPTINRFRGAETLQAQLDRIYGPTGESWQLSGGWSMPLPKELGRGIPSVERLVEQATGLVPPAIADADPSRPPAFEPLLARDTTVDLRNRDLALVHMAELLAARQRVVVVVADAARRAEQLTALVEPRRFALHAAAIADERIGSDALHTQLAAVRAADGPWLVLVDHVSLPEALATLGDTPDTIVVHDPPATDAQRDTLARAAQPLHLVFGAREARFTADALAAALDVRALLGPAWKHLRDRGPAGAAELTDVIIGAGPYAPPPGALVHGLRSLFERGMLRRSSDGSIVAEDPRTATASTPS